MYSKIRDDIVACNFLHESISYNELENKTNILAKKIQLALGFKKQMPVVIYHKRGIEFIEYIIAVLKCGCYYIPLEHNNPIERVKYIYNDVNAALIITDLQDKFESKAYNIISLDIGENQLQCNFINVKICESDLVYVMYTSGTSGKPKGVKIMYSNLMNLIKSFYFIVYRKFKRPVSVGVMSSFSFDASVKQIFCSLYYGHTLCIAEDNTRYFGRKIHKFHFVNNLSICDSTPSHIKLMTMQKSKISSEIPFILVGGEILRWETLHYYIKSVTDKTTFINVYGPTECCVDVAYKIITFQELSDNESGIVPIGNEILNTNLILRNEYGSTINDIMIKGELVISGKQVGAGYINTLSDAFVYEKGEVLYKTGDIAYYDNDNNLVIVGRKDTQVNIRGHRIELQEVQSVISSYILNPCVVLLIEYNFSSNLVAFIFSQNFTIEDSVNLKSYLNLTLPTFMIPSYYIGCLSLPTTNNGKIDEEELYKTFINYRISKP